MIKGLFFVLFFIWLAVSMCSLFVGQMVGFSRKNLRCELQEFVARKDPRFIFEIARMGIFYFAKIGFLFPASHPIFGLIGAIIWLFILNLI